MADCRCLLSSFVVLLAISVGIFLHATRDQLTPVPDDLRKDHYWGQESWKLGNPVPKDDERIRSFEIAVDETVLQDLKARLKNSRIQESIPGTNFEYGFHSNHLKKVVDYWSNKYDWRKEEQNLNLVKHFKTQIEGLDIHFVHVKPKPGSVSVPLLLVHGWPGSFVEFLKIIPHLSEGSDVDFELIIPSIPGYGFSEASHKVGMNLAHISRIFVKLMHRLGHDKFLYQGGDWGAAIGTVMAGIFPQNLIGLHTNFAAVKMGTRDWLRLLVADFGFPGLVFDDPDSEVKRMNPLSKMVTSILKESGYMHIQATKPDTVGVGLNDSPAGLAAYLMEKFSTWTNAANIEKPDGGLTEKFSLDELLTNVMIYWINGNIASSQRLYKESMPSFNDNFGIHVPFGALVGRHELPFSAPRTIIKNRIPSLIHYGDAETGGHFLAMEEPKLLAHDIREFYSKVIAAK